MHANMPSHIWYDYSSNTPLHSAKRSVTLLLQMRAYQTWSSESPRTILVCDSFSDSLASKATMHLQSDTGSVASSSPPLLPRQGDSCRKLKTAKLNDLVAICSRPSQCERGKVACKHNYTNIHYTSESGMTSGLMNTIIWSRCLHRGARNLTKLWIFINWLYSWVGINIDQRAYGW